MNEQEFKTPEQEEKEKKEMLRSVIIGIVVILIFTGVYFVFRGDTEAPQVPAQTPDVKTEQTAEDKTGYDTEALLKGENPEATASAEETENKEAENTEDIYGSYDIKYTQQEAQKIAMDVAKKQFGEDAFVIPASEDVPTEVEIDGKVRACYMFGADSMASMAAENATIAGLYHFDAVTGEIFDNGDGKMTKIN